ncbi:hypothetical protein AKJ16_DCAP14839, partial [Drosera capensis]
MTKTVPPSVSSSNLTLSYPTSFNPPPRTPVREIVVLEEEVAEAMPLRSVDPIVEVPDSLRAEKRARSQSPIRPTPASQALPGGRGNRAAGSSYFTLPWRIDSRASCSLTGTKSRVMLESLLRPVDRENLTSPFNLDKAVAESCRAMHQAISYFLRHVYHTDHAAEDISARTFRWSADRGLRNIPLSNFPLRTFPAVLQTEQ